MILVILGLTFPALAVVLDGFVVVEVVVVARVVVALV